MTPADLKLILHSASVLFWWIKEGAAGPPRCLLTWFNKDSCSVVAPDSGWIGWLVVQSRVTDLPEIYNEQVLSLL